MSYRNKKEILTLLATGQLSTLEAFQEIKKLDEFKDVVKQNDMDSSHNKLYFREEWEATPILSVHTPSPSLTTIVFIPDDLWENALTHSLGEQSFIMVMRGHEFSQEKDNFYKINPNKLTDYEKLFAELQAQNRIPDTMIHAWSMEAFTSDEHTIQSQLDQGVYSLFHLLKGFVKSKTNHSINLIYLYQCKEKESEPIYSSAGGLLKTVQLENPAITCKTIEWIGEIEPSIVWDMLLHEQKLSVDQGSEIRYFEGKRFSKRLKEVPQENETLQGLSLKQKGVYMITGGLGGVGYIFAEHLAKLKQARIILTGRTALNSKMEKKLNHLQQLGAEVLYMRADVSIRREVEIVFNDIKQRFGEINGIIHSAGVIKDSFFLKKSKQEFETVLAPKVWGTIWLDQVSKDEKLDFFVLFSSISSIIGNVGQCDYATGNKFMDSYAHWRSGQQRSGKTLSINWPYWDEGGMQLTMDQIEQLKRSTGMVPLRTETGLQAFDFGLVSQLSQFIVIEGDTKRIKNNLVRVEQEIEHDHSTQVPKNKASLSLQSTSILREKTENYLKEKLSKQIDLSVSRIDSQEYFEKYGIDSVLVMHLTKELEEEFGELSKTLFFEYQTIAELTQYFLKNHTEQLASLFKINELKENKAKINTISDKTLADPSTGSSHFSNRFNIENRKDTMRQTNSLTQQDFTNTEIAIIGISGRYPQADDLEQYWENIKNGKDCITEIPSDRWNYMDYFDQEKGKIGKSYSKWGGFLNDVDKFDPLFFNISPREAELMDPQERLFLEIVWETIENAGYTRDQLEKHTVGVFVGAMYSHYQLYGMEPSYREVGATPGATLATIANRVSYFFNFQGPSLSLDTMCSSSLTSIHMACESIRRGESDLAIAGGVNVSIHPHKFVVLSQGGFISSDGRCRSFGVGGDGYAPGEGVGAILLKPLSKAKEDGDYIHGVIKGSSVNHGGKTNGYMVPNPNAQAKLITETLKKSKIHPRTISYIEAQATGTPLGDPIEIAGLTKAYREFSDDKQFCSIGTVKANIGHLESASGMSGITKILLQMKNKQLVPSIHSHKLNPNINFLDSPFYVQHELVEWRQLVIIEDGKEKVYPRRAGINAFGAGGTNAHLILEEYIPQHTPVSSSKEESHIFVLSARNQKRLKSYVKNMIRFLEKMHVPKVDYNHHSDELLSHVIEELKKLISSVLKIDGTSIDQNEEISEYGFDVLHIAELSEILNTKWSVEINPAIFSEFSSLGEIATFICENYRDKLNSFYSNLQGPLEPAARNESISLADLSYTLQVGREPMGERLALIVSSVDELIEKLKGYDDVLLHQENVFKSQEIGLTDLFEGESGKQYISYVLENKELTQLAKLWVSGIDFDWGMLHDRQNRMRLPLPTYPFARDRYWLPQLEERIQQNENVLPSMNKTIHVGDPSPSETNKNDAAKSTALHGTKEDQIREFLLSSVSQILKLPIEEINCKENLMMYGLESMASMQLINSVQEYYQIKLPLKVFFEHSSIHELTDYLLKELQDSLPNLPDHLQNGFDEPSPSNRIMPSILLEVISEGLLSPEQALELENADDISSFILTSLNEGTLTLEQSIRLEEKLQRI